MIFPKWIRQGDCIGVTAPSDGVTNPLDIRRFENGKKKIEEHGNRVIFTDNVFKSIPGGPSSSGKERGEQFNQLLKDETIRGIYSAKGGNYLVEMLPYVDFDRIVSDPKWVQGYSDNTSLLYTITTKYDVATAYGCNFGDYGMNQWDESVIQNYQLLHGMSDGCQGFLMYQDGFGPDRVTGLEGYTCDKPSKWINGRNEKKIEMTGRLLGGCADVLFFINGTKYDGTLSYIEKYKKDGIIWYFESFCCNADDLLMNLWHLKELGWFQYAKGFIFGRPMFFESYGGKTYESTVMYVLEDLGVPIIFNADIGHKGPQITMINGAIATIKSENGSGSVSYHLKKKKATKKD